MKQQQQVVLPVKCVGCGTVFDLWYDLLQQEGRGLDIAEVRESILDNEHHCWRCRDRIKEDMEEMQQSNEIEIEIAEDSDFDEEDF